jgi:hypothetical protein
MLKEEKELESSARAGRRSARESSMKKKATKAPAPRADEDTMRDEYDFSKAARGTTAARYAEGTNVVLIDPDLAEIFPNARAVNEALRTLAGLAKAGGSVIEKRNP